MLAVKSSVVGLRRSTEVWPRGSSVGATAAILAPKTGGVLLYVNLNAYGHYRHTDAHQVPSDGAAPSGNSAETVNWPRINTNRRPSAHGWVLLSTGAND